MIHVLAPGFQTTVQDLGRYGYAHLGVSASGAADAFALRAANRLVGNLEGAAALEMTLTGGIFTFEDDATAALTGSDFGAGLPMWEAVAVRAGETLRCGPTRSGARCYLAVRGGIAVPPVMGSASTHLLSGLGGRALRKGDQLPVGTAMAAPPCRRRAVPPDLSPMVRVTPGPQADWFPRGLHGTYEVTEESNRMGLRLRGAAISRPVREMLTEGVPLGAVQVPPDGQPIILFVEQQTTGGYPQIACVIAADRRALGQLRPRDAVRFQETGLPAALALLRQQEAWLHGLA